tara:strand:+ start:8728 stop:9363 length:636 start_codon:yes stop_codon:yes gene_type:complete
MKKSELKEMIRQGMLEDIQSNVTEAKKDKEEEEDIEVEDIEDIEDVEDVEIEDTEEEEISTPSEGGIAGDEKKVQDSLESALIAAKELGDEKLINQIGNSITFFTRSHVVGSGEENLEEEVEESFNKATEYGMDNYKGDLMWADYSDIGQFSTDPEILDKLSGYDLYLKGIDIVKREYNGNVDKAYKDRVQSNMENLYERKKMLKIAGIIK